MPLIRVETVPLERIFLFLEALRRSYQYWSEWNAGRGRRATRLGTTFHHDSRDPRLSAHGFALSITGQSSRGETFRTATPRGSIINRHNLHSSQQLIARPFQSSFSESSLHRAFPSFRRLLTVLPLIGPPAVLPRNSTRIGSPHRPTFPCFPLSCVLNMASFARPSRPLEQQLSFSTPLHAGHHGFTTLWRVMRLAPRSCTHANDQSLALS